jgi:hypothetical protein
MKKPLPRIDFFFKNLVYEFKQGGIDIYNTSSNLIKNKYKPCKFIKEAFQAAKDFILHHPLITTITLIALTLISIVALVLLLVMPIPLVISIATFQLLLVSPLALGITAITNGCAFFKALAYETFCLFPYEKNAQELGFKKRLPAMAKRIILNKTFSFNEITKLVKDFFNSKK